MMENDGLLKTIEELLTEDLRQMVLSGRMQADGPMKVLGSARFLTGGALKFQAEEFVGKQAFHKNLPKEEAESYATGLLGTSFKQAPGGDGRPRGIGSREQKGQGHNP